LSVECAITVAVVSWNTRDLLAKCLHSLMEPAQRGLADVWVVDNGSTDGSRELVADEFAWVTLATPEKNLGYGPAVNVVARRTSTEWIAPANADIELMPGALEALLEAGRMDPQAGVIAPKLVLSDGSVQPSIRPYPTLSNALLLHGRAYWVSRRAAEQLYRPGHWDTDRRARVQWAAGAFLLVRRAAFDEVGGFDDAQWMYAEDLDLCWRMRGAGWDTQFEPGGTVRHALSAAGDKAFGDYDARALRWGQATYSWIARRRGVVMAWTIAALELVDAAVILAVSTVPGLVSDSWRERASRARRSIGTSRMGLRSRRALLAPPRRADNFEITRG
jgi:GT2 family glycosyltransferase